MLLVKMEKPLYPVAKEGNHKVVELLLSREDIEVNPMGMDGDTPLNNAAYEGYHMVVVEILASAAAGSDGDGRRLGHLGCESY